MHRRHLLEGSVLRNPFTVCLQDLFHVVVLEVVDDGDVINVLAILGLYFASLSETVSFNPVLLHKL